ncbi:hypothetical protein OAB85_03505 [Pseudomonadales bacterium]|nr:hypothetical protein [Pseudomonadales bacterium]
MSDAIVDDDFEVLRLDASPYEQLSSLTDWHLSFALAFPATFYDVNTVLGALGIKSTAHTVRRKEFRIVTQLLSPPRFKKFIDQLSTLAYLPENTAVGVRFTKVPVRAKKTVFENLEEVIANEKQSEKMRGSLRELIRISLEAIPKERDREVIIRRLGFDERPVETLEQIAHTFGITRERIRQIEEKALKKLERQSLWDDVVRDEITLMFQSIGPLLDVSKLASYSSWFEGFSLTKNGWKTFLRVFAPSITLMDHMQKIWLIPEHLADVLEGCLSTYFDLFRAGANKDELINALGSNLNDSYARHLYDEFSAANSSELTIATLATVFLTEASAPVSSEDFFAYCLKRSPKDLRGKFRTIENALSRESVPVSRAPAKYVTKKTIGLSDMELQNYIDAFYRHWLKNYDLGRIFHGDEVRDWAVENGFTFNTHEDWTSWWATAPLKLDPKGRYKADKLVVALNEVWGHEQVPTRNEFVSELLRVTGHSMRTKEIRGALYSKIGMGDFFQLNENNEIFALGDGRFEYRKRIS